MFYDINHKVIRAQNVFIRPENDMSEYHKQIYEDSLVFEYRDIKGINKAKEWILKNSEINRTKIILKKGESIKMKINWETPYYDGDIFYSYDFNPNEVYFFRIALINESGKIEKYLLKSERKTLKRKGIKIFNGTIFSNRAPMIHFSKR